MTQDDIETKTALENPNTTVVPAPAAPGSPSNPATAAVPAQSGTNSPSVSDTDNGQPFPPPGGAGRPAQAVVTAQSEPTHSVKPPIDPRPLALLKEKDPARYSMVMDAASVTGASPERIAAHGWVESKFNPHATGADGEIGQMQLLPSTIKSENLTANGRLDPYNEGDNYVMAGTLINKLDSIYGKDSVNSVRHYNGSGPQSWQYLNRDGFSFFPGQKFDDQTKLALDQQAHQAQNPRATARGMVEAGTKGGPDGFLQYVAQTAPTGMGMSDAWRHAEDLLVKAFITKGDMVGAQHARDYVLQMSHAGSNQYLMAAHQALTAGDGVGAAQALAKAHAFFPDGTIGRFRSDGRNVWADRVDESDPSRRLGPSVPVTSAGIAGLLNQTTDPGQFLKTLREEQAAAADARYKDLHGKYYADLPAERRYAADTRAQATVDAAGVRAQGQVDAAAVRKGGGTDNALNRQVDKETQELYGANSVDPSMANLSDEQRANLAETHKGVRQYGATPVQAERVSKGLSDGTLKLMRLQNGNYGVVGGGNSQPIAYLPQAVGDRLTAGKQQSAIPVSPVGAGAATGYAQGAGVTNNLAGTVMPQQTPVQQSSAIPVSR